MMAGLSSQLVTLKSEYGYAQIEINQLKYRISHLESKKSIFEDRSNAWEERHKVVLEQLCQSQEMPLVNTGKVIKRISSRLDQLRVCT